MLDAATSDAAVRSNAYENALVSYLGRLVYSYDDRYVLTGTIRRDGSSRFTPSNQYGVFPSIAAGWNVSNESFFAPLAEKITTFKVRASYGVLGNQNIPDYLYNANITYNTNYVIGTGQTTWIGATQLALPSSNIKWETSKTSDVGVDLGFFGNKLNLTADYFIKKNSDVLLRVPTPLSSGTSDLPPYVNAGQITNKGLETALSYRHVGESFTYQFTGTLTAITNTVDNLATGSQQIFGGEPIYRGAASTVTQAGLPVGSFYLIKTDGIFQNQAEIDAYAKNGKLIQPNAKPGDIKFEDANGDGLIDQNDRQLAGSPTPKLSYGFGGNAAWHGLDFSVFFQGTYGNKIYNGFRQDLESMNLEQNYAKTTLNAWTPQNTNTDMPRAVINDPNFNGQTSTRFLESGSYLRLRTLQLGYTLPKSFREKLKTNECRFYVSFDNLFTITDYKGYNPDLGGAGSVLSRSVDRATVAYPLARTSMLGVQLSF